MLPFTLVVLPITAGVIFLLVTFIPEQVLKTILEFIKELDLIGQTENKRWKDGSGLSYLPLVSRT